jgi:putative tricarboxylic transport membrane protein
MYLGNIMLLVLNLPLIPLWVQVLKIPYRYLLPLITLFCIVGAYSLSNNPADIMVMFAFGVLGYIFRKIGYEGAPMVLGMILGPFLEKAFSQSLILSDGDMTVFFKRPISLSILVFLVILAFIPFAIKLKERTGESGFRED